MRPSSCLISLSLIITLALFSRCHSRSAIEYVDLGVSLQLTESEDPQVMTQTALRFCRYDSPREALSAAFQLVQSAFHKEPADAGIALAVAKASHLIWDLVEDKQTRLSIVRKGLAAARVADAHQHTPTTAYYHGVFWGRMIQHRGISAIGHLPELESLFQQSLQDPQIDRGGPDRALGMLYLKAPAWPRGVGDLDLALDHLHAALGIDASFPLNHFFYAQALVEDGRGNLAREHLQQAEHLIESGAFGEHGVVWQNDIKRFKARSFSD